MKNELNNVVSEMKKEVIETMEMGNSRQIVSHYDARIAQRLLKIIEYKNTWDILLGCICSNTLNTYVKQKDSELGYSFKADIVKITNYLTEVEDPNVRFSVYMDKRMPLLVVEIAGIQQFSFHQIKVNRKLLEKSESLEKTYGPLRWNGVRNQKAAVSIYKYIQKIIQQCSDPFVLFQATWYVDKYYKKDSDKECQTKLIEYLKV